MERDCMGRFISFNFNRTTPGEPHCLVTTNIHPWRSKAVPHVVADEACGSHDEDGDPSPVGPPDVREGSHVFLLGDAALGSGGMGGRVEGATRGVGGLPAILG
uniref:Uncharacterized protein n=1 Tax=Oryza barthii TaxID=65489 RepID=A0A0D3G7R3_9ORYZ